MFLVDPASATWKKKGEETKTIKCLSGLCASQMKIERKSKTLNISYMV